MIWVLELRFKCISLSIYFFDSFSSTHIPTFDSILHMITLTIFDQELIAMRIEIIGNNIGSLGGGPDGQRPHSTENISQTFPFVDQGQNSIPLLLKPGAPVDFFEIKLESDPNLLHLDKIGWLTSHVLELGGSVDVVKFLGFVAHCSDISTFGQCYLANCTGVFTLFRG